MQKLSESSAVNRAVTTDRGREFAGLVYTILIAEKRYLAKAIAAEMGIGYDSLHARLVNRTSFTANEIRDLIRAAPDPRLVAYLLRGTAYVPADRADLDPAGVDEEEAIHRGATRIVIEATDVLKAVEEALSDHRLDHRDALTIRNEIEIAERALASLRERLRRMAPRVVSSEI